MSLRYNCTRYSKFTSRPVFFLFVRENSNSLQQNQQQQKFQQNGIREMTQIKAVEECFSVNVK